MSFASCSFRPAKIIASHRWGLGTPVLLLLVIAASAFTAVAPANADTASAMRRCIIGERASGRRVRESLGQQSRGRQHSFRNESPNILQPGDVFSISATGWVRNDLWGHTWGPAGDGYPAPGSFPFAGISQYSDIVRLNNNPGGWVGKPHVVTEYGGCNHWESGYPVRFLFYVNDSELWDNAGYWTNNVKIWRASAP